MNQSIVLLAGLLVAGTALAQPPGGAGGGLPTNEVIFERNDTNKDGEITQAEAEAAGTQLGQTWATWDLNSDGKVVAEELDTMRGRLGGPGGAGAPGAGGRAGGAAAGQAGSADDADDVDAAE